MASKLILAICSFLVIICYSTANFDDSGLDLVVLSPTNPGDVYIVSQFLVILEAASACVQEYSLNVLSPLDYAANQLYVENCKCTNDDWNTYIWNKNNGRLLFVMQQRKLHELIYAAEDLFESYNLDSYDTVFNELLGINDYEITLATYEIYLALGNIIAELIGIGSNSPIALFNLQGMLIYYLHLPRVNCIISIYSPLQYLANIESIWELVGHVSYISILLDAYGYWNSVFIFLDGLHPSKTQSGSIISHLIGDKHRMDYLEYAVFSLMSLLDVEEAINLIAGLLISVAVDDSVDGYIGGLFATPSLCIPTPIF